jgi:acetolactate synthase-1/3 small subunit
MPTALATKTTAATGVAPLTPGSLHTISLLVANKPGVLVRVALVFARRGYNIESLVVSPAVAGAEGGSGLGDFSRMTITCSGDLETLEQIIKQLEKLIDVVHAIDHTGQAVIETEVALVKVKASLAERTTVLQVAEHYHAKVVDYASDSLIMRVVGESAKLDALIGLVMPFGIIELVRSGKIIMTRGLAET